MKLKICACILILGFLFSCDNSKAPSTYTSGSVNILVDETFAPIIEDQAYVFESTYTEGKLNIIYKPENEILKLFLNDSSRVAILSRQLTASEAKFYKNRNIILRINRFAVDGLALITKRGSVDSLITVNEIISVMQGKPNRIKNLVFDNPNSSTVRYLKQLAGVTEIPKNGVYALKSNPDVINYVINNPGSIGVVGINWIVQPDKKMEEQVKKIKILGVKNVTGKPGSDGYYKPNQNDLAMEVYPLTRNLYIINGEGRAGLGTGFATFIAGERGQRIVLKSGLLPDSLPSRQIIINNNN
ncbi:MAG: substrate-binding domain-containing protein [Flavobacterium sp.]|nr:substrate-binding domain-containing protein [Pedobacter sp.]